MFDDRAREARDILEMNRSQLENLPAGRERLAECYHRPATYDLRLTCLDAICESSHGVEAFQIKNGDVCEYLNTGDTYSVTLIYFKGRYRVASWGDIAERHGSV